MARHVITLSIIVDISRWTSSNRENRYVIILFSSSSSSRATLQVVENSNRRSLHHTNPNYLDTVLAITRMSRFKPNCSRFTSIRIHYTVSVRYKYVSSNEKDVTCLILRAHTTPRWQFFSASLLSYTGNFSLSDIPPYQLLILMSEGLRPALRRRS